MLVYEASIPTPFFLQSFLSFFFLEVIRKEKSFMEQQKSFPKRLTGFYYFLFRTFATKEFRIMTEIYHLMKLHLIILHIYVPVLCMYAVRI